MNTARFLVDALLALLLFEGPVEGSSPGEENGDPGILVGD